MKRQCITVGADIFPDGFDPSAYGMVVEGDCMQPAVFHGEMVICSPAAALRPGDLVAIIPADEGQPQIKRLVGMPPFPPGCCNGDVIALLMVEMLNPARRLAVPLTKVKAIHRVVHVYREEEIPSLRSPSPKAARARGRRAGGRT